MTPFSELMAGAQGTGGALVVDVPEDWKQGRSVFGGLQTAIGVHAMRGLVPEGALRTVQTTFVAPVEGRVEVRSHVLRRGRSATHVEARLHDGNDTLALVIGVFGAARSSVVSVTPRQPVVERGTPIELPYVPGVTPSFIQHFAARWLRGQPPFRGDTACQHVVEVDMRDQGMASEGHVIAIADFVPPVALTHLRTPAFGSTLTWALELLDDRMGHLPLAGWRADVELVAARDGYTNQEVMLWGPGGEPVALSRQSMLVFA